MIETAVILCGGAGTRLYPITQRIPKSLITISDEYTILSYQLMQLRAAGVKTIYLLAGEKGGQIASFAARFCNMGLTIKTILDEKPSGTTPALLNVLGELSDKSFILMNGDVIADVNFRLMAEELEDNIAPAILYSTNLKSPYGVITGENDIKFEEKPLLENVWINGGIYMFKAGFLKKGMWAEDSINIEDKLLPLLFEEGLINIFRNENYLFWTSIDSPKDLEVVRTEIARRIFKPWGYEKIIDAKAITHKQLFIFQGESTSLHYHKEKAERMYVKNGTCFIDIQKGSEIESIYCTTGDSQIIDVNQVHRIRAITDVTIEEFSTTASLTDVYRVADDYSYRRSQNDLSKL